ncbi:Hypothetical protein A7982_02380 [Minicystis rosea]|nr:Hypothetical protein A7982_02380 [Minicystis rosea]
MPTHVRSRSAPNTSSPARVLLALAAALSACANHPAPSGSASTTVPAPTAPGDSPAAASAPAAAPSASASAATSAPSSSAPPTASAASGSPADPAAPALSWLGVPVDPSIRFAKKVRNPAEHSPVWGFAGEIQVPVGWRGKHVENLPQGFAVLNAPDDTAAIVLVNYELAPWNEDFVNGRAEYWAGGELLLQFEGWGPPVPIAIGDQHTPGSLLHGKGLRKKKPQELWLIRRRFPSATTGNSVLMAVGVIDVDAPALRRAELLAALASFTPENVGAGPTRRP